MFIIILYLIEEGTQVQPGDLLCELDTIDLDTTEDYLPPLIGFFRRRARVMR